MAKKETKNEPKELIEATPEEVTKLEIELEKKNIEELPVDIKKLSREEITRTSIIESWAPKTNLGKSVRAGSIKNIDEIIKRGDKILEPEIVDSLIPVETDLLLAGQSKGKFGGGKRRAWRQTQRKTMEGNVVTFSSLAVVGDKNGHVGIGFGKSKETLPSRDKATRRAKLNIIKVTRGFESREEDKSDPHTVPFKVEGKCGSVRITILPAPRGTGLVAGAECKKILKLAGIKDAYTVTKGQTRTTLNLAKAVIDALTKTGEMKQ